MLCYEQFCLDVEVFRYDRRLHIGIGTDRDQWLEDVIARTGPGGNFLTHPSTRDALRLGEWYLGNLGEAEIYPEEAQLARRGAGTDRANPGRRASRCRLRPL